MIIVVQGMIGRGINGQAEIRITVPDNTIIDFNKPVNTVIGELKSYDTYFKEHPLAGKKKFTIPTSKIVMILEDVNV